MISNVNQFLGAVAETELARTARRSARTIWNAHRAAFDTTRVEAGKVLHVAIGEGQRLAGRARTPVPQKAPRRSTRRSTRRKTRRAA